MTIGITGTIGAGKGAIVDYLKTKGFKHYSVRDVLLSEIERRGIPPTRESMQLVADDFRKNSPGFIAEQLLKEREKFSGNAIIESIRAVGEIDFLRSKAKDFVLLAIDADPKIRYERIYARKSTTDNVTYEHFIEYEKTEFKNTEPWKMNLMACIRQADIVILNNSSLEDLYKEVDKALKI